MIAMRYYDKSKLNWLIIEKSFIFVQAKWRLRFDSSYWRLSRVGRFPSHFFSQM